MSTNASWCFFYTLKHVSKVKDFVANASTKEVTDFQITINLPFDAAIPKIFF